MRYTYKSRSQKPVDYIQCAKCGEWVRIAWLAKHVAVKHPKGK